MNFIRENAQDGRRTGFYWGFFTCFFRSVTWPGDYLSHKAHAKSIPCCLLIHCIALRLAAFLTAKVLQAFGMDRVLLSCSINE